MSDKPTPWTETFSDTPNPKFDALFRSPIPFESEEEERSVEAQRYAAFFDLILNAYAEWHPKPQNPPS